MFRFHLIVKQFLLIVVITFIHLQWPRMQLSTFIESLARGSGIIHLLRHPSPGPCFHSGLPIHPSTSRDTTPAISWGADARRYASRMSPRIVNTQYGKLRGILIALPHRDLPVVEGFFGLPYASLLGGELRFMPPTAPMEKWEEIRVAIDFKSVCPQRKPNIEELESRGTPRVRLEFYKRLLPFLENQHEECLNLNIYLPFRAKNDTDLLPVILFIHGESFESGTGNAYDGSVMAAFGHVMVITLNYRLGVLGFLSTDDSNALGNYAILDQVAALHWLKENIQSFGGNPNDVTIFGHSYGAVLTNILLISPVTRDKNLFRRAILYDGSVLSSWAVSEDPLPFTKELSEKVNCSMFWNQTIRLVGCLKQKPWEELISVEVSSPMFFSTFGPTTDRKSVLPDDIGSLMRPSSSSSSSSSSSVNIDLSSSHSSEFLSKPGPIHPPTQDSNPSSIPLILGCSRQAGHKFLTQAELDHGVQGFKMKQTLRTLIRNTYVFHRQKIYDIVAYHYGEWDKPRDSRVVASSIAQLLGDNQIAAPLVKLARLSSKLQSHSETYFFAFGHNEQDDKHAHLQRHVGFNRSIGHQSRPSESKGSPSTHQSSFVTELSDTSFDDGDLVSYVFGAPLVDNLDPFQSTFTKNEKSLSEILLRYWTNFARTGNPNNGGRFEETSRAVTSWPLYRHEEQEYMSLVSKGSHGSLATVRHHYRGAKMGLWLDLIPKIHRSDNLERKFHLLDHHGNKSTFEGSGTKDVNWADHVVRRQHTTLQMAQNRTTSSAAEFFEQSDKTSENSEKANKLEADKKERIKPESSLLPTGGGNDTKMYFLHSTRSPGNAKSIIAINFSTMKNSLKPQGSKHNGEVDNVHNPNMSLSITVIVGSALLALNAIIFICMCRQKQKTRQTLTQLEKRNANCQDQGCTCGNSKANSSREVGKKNSSIRSTGGGSSRSVAIKSCSSKSTFDCLEETLSQISCNSSGSGLSGKTDDCKHNPTCRDNRTTRHQPPPLSLHAPLSIQQFQPFAQHFQQHQGNSSFIHSQQKVVQFKIPSHESNVDGTSSSTLDNKRPINCLVDQRTHLQLSSKQKYLQDVPSMHQIVEFTQQTPCGPHLLNECGSKTSTTPGQGPSRKESGMSSNSDVRYGPDPSTTV